MTRSPGPRVAVIVTCFDSGATLDEAVSSVRHEPVELVIVDDGSTDRATLELLSVFEHEGLRVLHQPNRGISAALMTGVEATSSPYLFPLGGDDIVEPGALLRLADALDANSGAAVAWGDLQTFGLTSFLVPSAPSLDPWLVTFANLVPSSSLFRRTALLDVGGWKLARGGYEDWDVLMSLAEHGHTGVYVPGVVYRYRRNTLGLLATSLERFGEHYEELRRRHSRLFAERRRSRRTSRAPRSLKLLLPLTDAAPGLGRLGKVRLAQLLTHLLWNGGIRATIPIVRQGIALRSRRSRR